MVGVKVHGSHAEYRIGNSIEENRGTLNIGPDGRIYGFEQKYDLDGKPRGGVSALVGFEEEGRGLIKLLKFANPSGVQKSVSIELLEKSSKVMQKDGDLYVGKWMSLVGDNFSRLQSMSEISLALKNQDVSFLNSIGFDNLVYKTIFNPSLYPNLEYMGQDVERIIEKLDK